MTTSNLFGLGIHNSDVVVPAWQHRAVGDLVLADAKGSGGWYEMEVLPGEACPEWCMGLAPGRRQPQRAHSVGSLDEPSAGPSRRRRSSALGRSSLRDCEVVSAALLTAAFACVEHWYLDGGTGDLVEQIVRAIELIQPAWSTVEHEH